MGAGAAGRTNEPADNCSSLSKQTLLRLKLAGIAVIFLIGMTAAAQAISIQFESGVFKVVGWKAAMPAKGWASVFVVYAGLGDVPPLLGTYAVEGDSLVFRPSFPIAPGVGYRAVFQSPGGPAIEKTFSGARGETIPLARVEHVYPSGDVLPSNLLRLYIYFSAPMSRGEAGQHIYILDEKGKVLPDVFLPGEELWDPRYTRLTMTFDPGRIKRGLTSNQKMGPPIAEGNRYTLVIDRDWKDARGVGMVAGFRKSFRGGPAERDPPDPKQWRVHAPKADTTQDLAVDFPKPMNFPLLQRMLQVSSRRGTMIGKISVARNETQWRLTPKEPWKAGDYQLLVDTGIEDLAGNHIGQAFDVDVFDHATEHITTETVSVPFTVN